MKLQQIRDIKSKDQLKLAVNEYNQLLNQLTVSDTAAMSRTILTKASELNVSLEELNAMVSDYKCQDCNGSGIALVTLDSTKDVGIQRCDTCQVLTDAQAIALVKEKFGLK